MKETVLLNISYSLGYLFVQGYSLMFVINIVNVFHTKSSTVTLYDIKMCGFSHLCFVEHSKEGMGWGGREKRKT